MTFRVLSVRVSFFEDPTADHTESDKKSDFNKGLVTTSSACSGD